MSQFGKKITPALKAKAAIEAIKGDKTNAELGAQFGVHSKTIQIWKRKVLDNAPVIFSDHHNKKEQDDELLTDELYKQIGQLKVEVDWLKKKSGVIC